MEDGTGRAPRPTIKNPTILAQRRRELAEAATRVFTRRGFANAGVGEVAEEAGISIGSMYKYVESKDQLLWMVMDYVYTNLEDQINFEISSHNLASEKLVSIIVAHLMSASMMAPEIRLMYREHGNLRPDWQKEFIIRDEKVLRLIEGTIIKGNNEKEFNCSLVRTAALNIFGTSIWLALKRWAVSGLTLKEYIISQCQLMLILVGASNDAIRLQISRLDHELEDLESQSRIAI